MLCINRVIISGQLVSDPKSKETDKNKDCASFELGTKRGQKIEIICFGKVAQQTLQTLREDKEVLVEGSIETANGFRVVADTITFLEREIDEDS